MNELHAELAAEVDSGTDKEPSKSGLMEVFASEMGRLKRLVAGMGLNASDGEDVLQDVSIRALKHSKMFKCRQDCVHWLIKVTVNRCLMEHRSRKRFRRQAREILKRHQEMKGTTKASVEKVIDAEELEIVRESMKDLNDSLLAPMVLQYFCDLNSTEVGRILGLNSSTVRSRLREGRMILAKRLLERGIGT
ncbi:MAG: sigma-70 family RNA polymerase sigma factor [Sedimentisphaerales bacterium]|nr:sigma-70 family RNA polymerase sigma factor [Sedimentisphaerales bacterium]